MEIDKKRITCWSQKKETNYTYYDKELGEVKVKVIDIINDEGEQLQPTQVKIRKDDYCIPELTKAVINKHINSSLA